MNPIRFAIVDDAVFVRKSLARMFTDEPRIEVVGAAATGEELLEHLDTWRPDVISLDLNMPGMGGMATLEQVVERSKIPVIILSTKSGEGAPMTLEALSRGAVDFIDKEAHSLVDFEGLRAVLLKKILGVCGTDTPAHPRPTSVPAAPPPRRQSPMPPGTSPFDLISIGASTGGPGAIETVLTALGDQVPVPIVVAVHMPTGFTGAFADRLNRALPLNVVEGRPDIPLVPGGAVIAPGGLHTRVAGSPGEFRVALDREPRDAPNRPSVDELFASCAGIEGARTLAVLLTGMGRDGARGMGIIHQAGGHTIAQDEGTSVVFGMPRAAIEAGVAREVLALEQIGPRVNALLSSSPVRG